MPDDTKKILLKSPLGGISEFDNPEDAQTSVREGGYSVPTSDDLSQHAQDQYYSSTPQIAKTVLEQAASGATLGLSKIAEAKLGIASPEDILARQRINPIASTAGNIAGFAGALALLPEEGLLQAITPAAQLVKAGKYVSGAAGLGKIASGALAASIEGLGFTGGDIVSEKALGEPNLSAHNIISRLGFGAVLGGALGGTATAASEGLGLIGSKLFPNGAATEAGSRVIADEASRGAQFADALSAPKSEAEIAQRLKDLNLPQGGGGLPSRQALLEAQENLPDFKLKAHDLQIQALDNTQARDIYGAAKEGGDESAVNYKKYESGQKAELMGITNDTIDKIAPNASITDNPVEGGQKAIKSFQNQYEAEKKELGPIFKKFDTAAVNPVSYPGELIGRLEEAIPNVSKYLDFNSVDGPVGLSKYDPGMPFSKNVYGGLKDLVNTVNKEGVTLGEIRNLRNTLADRINLLSAPRDAMQIGNLKSSLMDYIGGEINKIAPDINAKEIFKRYAINEQNRQIVESIMGGKIGDNVSFAKKIVPEDVLSRIFSDSVSTSAAKQIMGNDGFNEALANYLKSNISKVSDPAKNGFSSARFATFLKSKAPELAEAFKENPGIIQRIKSANDIMRILPDAPSPNPSGTAKTLMNLIKMDKVPKTWLELGGTLIKGVKEKIGDAVTGSRDTAIRNEILAGVSPDAAEAKVNERLTHYNVLSKLNEFSQKSAQKITSSVSNALSPEGISGKLIAPIASKISKELSEDKEKKLENFKKTSEKISSFQQNPDLLLDALESATKNIYPHAPDISGGMHKTLVSGVNFLNSVLPRQQTNSMFPEEFKPSDQELNRFMNYYSAIEKPISILDGLKTNTISMQQIDAVRSVYPELYTSMQSEVIKKLSSLKEKPSYQRRLSISMFLGQDPDSSTAPQMIAANQQALTMQKMGMGQQQDQKQMKTSQKGLSTINLANRSLTPQEQAAKRTESRET